MKVSVGKANAGLFGLLKGATIKKVNVNGNVTGGRAVGGIARICNK